jgi:hypothetical protein
MKKVPTIYVRDEDDPRHVTREINPDCQWVFDGAGTPTQKLDGTCVWIDPRGSMWKRFTLLPGREAPESFLECEHDEVTNKTFGWVLCRGETPSEKYHWEAYDALSEDTVTTLIDGFVYIEQWPSGTYELVGPKVQGGIERGFKRHYLWSHEGTELALLDEGPERTYDEICVYLMDWDAEGIVWHHPDGRWAKIKGRDFGFNRKKLQQSIIDEARGILPIQSATAQEIIDHGKGTI